MGSASTADPLKHGYKRIRRSLNIPQYCCARDRHVILKLFFLLIIVPTADLPKMVHGNAIALHAPAYSIPSGEPKQLDKVAMLEHILSTNEDYQTVCHLANFSN